MAFRNLMITIPAHISCRNGQLIVRGEQEISIPIEDLLSVLIESRQCTITTAALTALAQNGTAVYTCDEKHLPCAAMLPFAQHSRQLEVSRRQLGWAKPAKGRWWQQIVQAKIRNQAECLALCGLSRQAAFLYSRVAAVNRADPDNLEASAAAFYFSELFGKGFTRGDESDARNAALNYGYAILRGCMARCLCAYGFLPWLGLHHDNALNAYNLADDMMEPYRPAVDLFVAGQVDCDTRLDTRLKSYLFNLLNVDILSGQQKHSVAYAMERQVQSLRREDKTLTLSKLLVLRQHRYE